MAEHASSAAADTVARRSILIDRSSLPSPCRARDRAIQPRSPDRLTPPLPSLAPVSRTGWHRRGRDLAVVVDILHAISVHVSRPLQARLIAEKSADLRRAAGAIAPTSHHPHPPPAAAA